MTIGNENSIGKDEIYCNWYSCPNCGSGYVRHYDSFCSNCGCKLEWED